MASSQAGARSFSGRRRTASTRVSRSPSSDASNSPRPAATDSNSDGRKRIDRPLRGTVKSGVSTIALNCNTCVTSLFFAGAGGYRGFNDALDYFAAAGWSAGDADGNSGGGSAAKRYIAYCSRDGVDQPRAAEGGAGAPGAQLRTKWCGAGVQPGTGQYRVLRAHLRGSAQFRRSGGAVRVYGLDGFGREHRRGVSHG